MTMNEKEEKTVKPKSDVGYDYYKSRLEEENRVKEGFYQKTSFLIIAMTLVASFALYFLKIYFSWDLYSLVCCSLVAAGAVLFIKAFWHVYRMTHDCPTKYMPDPKEVRDYEKKVSTEAFNEYLINELADAAAYNANTNIRRGQHFYKAEMSLMFSFVFFAVFAIVDFSMNSSVGDKDTPDPPKPVIIKTGSGNGSNGR